MTEELIEQIQTFTLGARAALEAEAAEQLEGVYGWHPDGSFGASAEYPALAQIDEAKETRRRLQEFSADEQVVGLAPKDARRKLIRETAFTWLNRLAAFRLMEERRLLKPTVVKLDKSNGFIFWLTDEKTPEGQQAYALYQQGGLPLNVMGEGPSDVAYCRFLLWQCDQLAREVSVLFDPSTLASRLCPRPPALKQIVGEMNAEGCVEAWKPGNEEAIGWIYEGFIETENKDVFEQFSKGKKVQAEEIGAATQRFTPRWIVRFLVENSLGRLWVEMHPDSRLATSLTYLVPVEKPIKRPPKPVSEITFLDPCCGSMHFGFVAFDLFAEMYREELEYAGQPSWPAQASVTSPEDIPSSIAANNLFGIDIDARAMQIAALALLIKARTLQPKAHITDLNLACANVEQISGGKLDAFIAQAKFTHPIYERILRSLSARMKDSDHVGSLLRLEKTLEQLIAEERRKAEAGKQFQMSFPGLPADQFKTQEGIEEFFGLLSEQVLRHLDEFVRASRAAGSDPGHFVNEAAKGLRYLRLVSRHHDVVATNPPYMNRSNMSEVMAQHLDEQYPEAKSDLYAAFIARCVELAGPLGKVAMVTQQSFMFISSYEDLRSHLRSTVAVEEMAHLGPKAFPNITGEKVNTTAFILRREPDARLRDEQFGVYLRLVNEADAESKRQCFEQAVAALHKGQSSLIIFRYLPTDFDAIPGKPWVYWIPATLRRLFVELPPLASAAEVKEGINTGDNSRFMRFWWEVRAADTGREQRWCRFAKGDEFRRFANPSQYVVRNSVAELRTLPGCRMLNQEYFFKPAVGFLSNSSSDFCAWLTASDHIFCSTGGRSVFPKVSEVPFYVGLMNSKLFGALMGFVNPTITIKVGDVAVIPLPGGDRSELARLADEAIQVSSAQCAEDERHYDFRGPASWNARVQENILARKAKVGELSQRIDHEVARLYGIDSGILDGISEPSSNADENNEDESTRKETLASTSISPVDCAQRWISYSAGTVLGRYDIGEPGALGCGTFSTETAAAIRKLIDPDGIMTSDPNHPQDIVKSVLACLELMLGRDAAHTAIHTATGDNGEIKDVLRAWIDRQFWKYHCPLYRKRPIYWPLQSPKKKFTVWVFHDRFSKDTLFRVKDQFVQVKINWLNGRIHDLKPKTLSGDTRERRAAEKEISQLSDQLDDVQEFSERLKRISQRGYTPHIDDGVLLNAAPLWELLPSWPDTKKAWQELENEEYEWAQQAMEYWPDRVKKACQTNKSFAIAHGLA